MLFWVQNMSKGDDDGEHSGKRKITESNPNPDEPPQKKSKPGIKMLI